jgi:predicted ATPase
MKQNSIGRKERCSSDLTALSRIQKTLPLALPLPEEECFLQAIGVARRQQAKWFELRSATDLARLWQGQGKIMEARETLAQTLGWFTEGFDTADLKAAKTLLEELSS